MDRISPAASTNPNAATKIRDKIDSSSTNNGWESWMERAEVKFEARLKGINQTLNTIKEDCTETKTKMLELCQEIESSGEVAHLTFKGNKEVFGTYRGFSEQLEEIKKRGQDMYNVLLDMCDTPALQLEANQHSADRIHQIVTEFKDIFSESLISMNSQDASVAEPDKARHSLDFGQNKSMILAELASMKKIMEAKKTNNEALLDAKQKECSATELKIQELNGKLQVADQGLACSKIKADEEREDMQAQIQAARAATKKMFELVQNHQGNIRVMLRIRPLLKSESGEPLKDFGERITDDLMRNWAKFRIPEDEPSPLRGTRRTYKERELERIFGPEATNYAVFEEVQLFILSGLTGQRVSIFCYGPSGTGKTYTLSELKNIKQPDPNDGIIPQTVAMAFRHAKENESKYTYVFDLSIIEIYLNATYDLLVPGSSATQKITPGQETWVELRDYKSGVTKVKEALERRQQASTSVNSRSSRGHLIFCLRVTRNSVAGSDPEVVGLINLVDLAGSEKMAAKGSEEQIKQGISINLSLSDLTTMIGKLGRGEQPTPRETLCKQLRHSFEGGRILMLATVSPLERDYVKITKPTLDKAEQVQKARPRRPRATPTKTAARGANAPSRTGRTNTPPPTRTSSIKSLEYRLWDRSVTPTSGSSTEGIGVSACKTTKTQASK